MHGIRRVVKAIALGATISVMSAIGAVAETWPIKNFEVVGVEPAGYVEGNRPIHSLIEEYVRLLREAGFDPDRLPSQGPTLIMSERRANELREIEAAFELAARFFEAQGFRPPALEPVVTDANGEPAYRVYVIVTRPNWAGRYHAQVCSHQNRGERLIMLNYDSVATMNGVLAPSGYQTIAHELFHAVQFAYPLFATCGGGSPGPWITEGTARTAGWATVHHHNAGWLREWMGVSLFDAPWGLRNYSRTLPVPYNLEGRGPNEAYRTSSFWSFLAEYEHKNGNPNVPGVNNHSLSYLARIFESEIPDPSCHLPQPDCTSEIGWLDDQLRRVLRKRLSDLYPRFISAYSLYGLHRWRGRPFHDPSWIDESFSPDGCIPVVFRPDGEPVVETHIGRFDEISARCWQIRGFGFPGPDLPVAISVEMVTGAQEPSLEQLTFIEGGTQKPLKARLNSLPGDIQRVSWVHDFRQQETDSAPGRLALLTNVAKTAAETKALGALRVTFTRLVEYASLGRGNVNPTALADAIDTPLELEFSKYRAIVQPGLARKMDDLWVGETHSKGLINPCMLQVSAHRDHVAGKNFAESFLLNLQKSGPIQPGVYSVRQYRPPVYEHSEMFPDDEAAASVMLYDEPNEFVFETGKLTITSISPHLVTGHISGVAHHRDYSQSTGNYEIVASRTLAVKFSVRVKGVMGRYRETKYPCIDSTPRP